jgi:hypothetical protein
MPRGCSEDTWIFSGKLRHLFAFIVALLNDGRKRKSRRISICKNEIVYFGLLLQADKGTLTTARRWGGQMTFPTEKS